MKSKTTEPAKEQGASNRSLEITAWTIEQFNDAFRSLTTGRASGDDLEYYSSPIPVVVAWEKMREAGTAGRFEEIGELVGDMPEYEISLLERVPGPHIEELAREIPTILERAGDALCRKDDHSSGRLCYQAAFDLLSVLLVELFSRQAKPASSLNLGSDTRLSRLFAKGAHPGRFSSDFDSTSA